MVLLATGRAILDDITSRLDAFQRPLLECVAKTAAGR